MPIILFYFQFSVLLELRINIVLLWDKKLLCKINAWANRISLNSLIIFCIFLKEAYMYREFTSAIFKKLWDTASTVLHLGTAFYRLWQMKTARSCCSNLRFAHPIPFHTSPEGYYSIYSKLKMISCLLVPHYLQLTIKLKWNEEQCTLVGHIIICSVQGASMTLLLHSQLSQQKFLAKMHSQKKQ